MGWKLILSKSTLKTTLESVVKATVDLRYNR